MLQQIANDPKLMRCNTSNAIINMDSNSFNNYINTRSRLESQKDRIVSLDNQVAILQEEMENIKKLLSGLIK